MEDYLFGTGEPYFGSLHLTPFYMSINEVHAFNLCKDEFISTINPVKLVSELTRRLRIPKKACKTVIRLGEKGLDRERLCNLLFKLLPLFSTLQNLVICLDRCRYDNLATTLFWNLLKTRTTTLVVIQKASQELRSGLRDFSRKLKRGVHNAPFENRKIFVRRLAKLYVKRIEKERDQYTRQTYADKHITIIASEIDVQAIEFNTNLHKSSIFSHMKCIISETSNTLITDIGYYGRLANAHAIAGKFCDSEDMLREARCKSFNTGPGFELFNCLYTEVYVRLWQFETFPSSDLRDSLMFWGRLGLKSLEDGDIYSITVWKRNLIMRMVFCLLGLGNRGNVIEKCVVDDNCIEEACRLLQDFDRYLDGIETRRLMLYAVAKAMLFEIKDKNYEKCFECLTRAKRLAVEGCFKELSFITGYHFRIANMIKQLACHEMCSADLKQKNKASSDPKILNSVILNSFCSTTPFHSLTLQHEVPTGDYPMWQRFSTSPQSIYLFRQQPEETNNYSMMRQNETSLIDCNSINKHFILRHLSSVCCERNWDSFYGYRGEPNGCPRSDAYSLHSNTNKADYDIDLSISGKSYIPRVLFDNGNTSLKLLYDVQRCNQGALGRNCNVTGKASEINGGIRMLNFRNSTKETSDRCAGNAKTGMCYFTDSLFEACDIYEELLEATLCKYTKTELGVSKACEHVAEPRLQQRNPDIAGTFLSSISENQHLMSFHDCDLNVGLTDLPLLRCSYINELEGFIPETVRFPSFERSPPSGCSSTGDAPSLSLADEAHQENDIVFAFEKRLFQNSPRDTKRQNYEITEPLSVISDDMFGE